EMSGGWRQAKLVGRRPLDGRLGSNLKRRALMKTQYPAAWAPRPYGTAARILDYSIVRHDAVVSDLCDFFVQQARCKAIERETSLDWPARDRQRLISAVGAARPTKLKEVWRNNLVHSFEVESCFFTPQLLFEPFKRNAILFA